MAVIGAVGAFVGLVVVVELLAAVLPLIIILTCVAPHERAVLAQLIAATDSSRRLRIGRVLRLAVLARRAERATHTRDTAAGR